MDYVDDKVFDLTLFIKRMGFAVKPVLKVRQGNQKVAP